MTFPIVFLRYFVPEKSKKREFNSRYRKFGCQNRHLRG